MENPVHCLAPFPESKTNHKRIMVKFTYSGVNHGKNFNFTLAAHPALSVMTEN
jgi:hypothetical protein